MPGTMIRDMEVFDGKLFLGGGFDTVNTFTTGGIITWDGFQFDTLSSGTGNWVNSLSSIDDKLLITGTFNDFGGSIADKIVIWNGSDYELIGNSTYGFLADIPSSVGKEVHFHNEGYYITSNVSGVPPYLPDANLVFGFDTTSGWTDLKEGINNGVAESVDQLISYNGDLIVGGLFIGAGNPPVYLDNIARWDGTNWHPLDGGLNYDVREMVLDSMNNFLYVAGGFTQADGLNTGYLAKWDGYRWSQVGSYFGGYANKDAMVMYRNELFVSGVQLGSGNELDNHITRWDGESWSDVGGGMNDQATSLIEYDDTLWISGGFDTVGIGIQNLPSYRLAKWWMPANMHCNWLQPIIYVNNDSTVYVGDTVPFYNNNAYAQSWDWRIDGSSVYSNYDPTHTFTDTGWHDVEVVVSQDGCMDTAIVQVYVEEPVSTFEVRDIGFKVYPNPSSGKFIIELEQTIGVEMTIRTLGGKLILHQAISETKTEVKTDSWTSGTYVVTIKNGSGRNTSQSIIIE